MPNLNDKQTQMKLNGLDVAGLREEFSAALSSSRLKKTMTALMADQSPDLKPEKFCHNIAEIVVDQMMERLTQTLSSGPPDSSNGGDRSMTEFDDLVKAVLVEMRQTFLVNSLQMVSALGSAVAERDTGNSLHNYRVTLYATRFGEHLGLDEPQMQALIKGSFLHDIGKISIPDRILLKRGLLSREEREAMSGHVIVGGHIIREVKWLEDAADVVMFHHEKFDGTGYLSQLQGGEIPLIARLFAICDVFDSLTSQRPYRSPMPCADAVKYLKEESGKHFDPELLPKFIEIARHLHREITIRDRAGLERRIRVAVNRHFRVDSSIERFRSRYSAL